MLLRAMRQPRAGSPSPLARMLALVVLVGMVAVSAPVLLPVARWLFSLF